MLLGGSALGQGTQVHSQRSGHCSAANPVVNRLQTRNCGCKSSGACICGRVQSFSSACNSSPTQAAPTRQSHASHCKSASRAHKRVSPPLHSNAAAAAETEPEAAPVARDHADTASGPAAAFAPMTWPSRSHSCGQITVDDVGSTVTLCGWVDRNRDMGALQFFDMRDHTGLVQVSFIFVCVQGEAAYCGSSSLIICLVLRHRGCASSGRYGG